MANKLVINNGQRFSMLTVIQELEPLKKCRRALTTPKIEKNDTQSFRVGK
jgi:hypothetical protein